MKKSETPREMPNSEELKGELKRIGFKKQYKDIIKSTFFSLVAVATYEVDQIRIVLPHEVDELGLEIGEDLCTLVTCTPYGINTHRLLVRGHRVPNEYVSNVRITSDAIQIEPMVVAPIVAAPVLILLLVLVFTKSGRDKVSARVFAELRDDMTPDETEEFKKE